MTIETKQYKTIKVEKEDGITWLYFNRPEKRNAMNPTLHKEMTEALEELEQDDDTQVLVLTGAGDKSWCAGQDLKESMLDRDGQPRVRQRAGRPDWRSDILPNFPAPTIAMVNGFCFGGAFTALIACDIAIAAEDAIFGLSEINWGSIPGGMVTKFVVDTLSFRNSTYYIMTGEPFDGKKAAEMGLVTKAVPRGSLKEETVKLARSFLDKNPYVLRACKETLKFCREMDLNEAKDYISAKGTALRSLDVEGGRDKGLRQFVVDKTYRPGFGPHKR
ncbi:MAG: p-hydroxycinnamoyl CoA hydratase/lyase [Chloroflexi bacterium]|nr:p-hydroxycinnamoyl CoA hydratase/lyase [Chloroflexota bacterium]